MENRPSKNKQVVPRSLGGFTLFVGKEVLRQRKWVLLPVWLALAFVALLIVMGGGSAILPAIYVVF